MSKDFCAVITTIQPPTPAVRRVNAVVLENRGELIVIGDQKGPSEFELEGSRFFSLEAQRQLPFGLAALAPVGHYSRKNLGYLLAFAEGANCLYETDDDNAPGDTWVMRSERVRAHRVTERGWVNVYRFFGGGRIWPRGYALSALAEQNAALTPSVAAKRTEVRAPIQQGLADGAPDVDAIWNIVFQGSFCFAKGPSVYLGEGSWCPFNSQSTWWWPIAYPLMYLPSHCSFRMTDIWRSFIAQRCLWALGLGIVFNGPEVVQERNVHDLTRDFADEVPGYLRNAELVRTLEAVSLSGAPLAMTENLMACYEALVRKRFFPEVELQLIEAWLADLSLIRSDRSAVLP